MCVCGGGVEESFLFGSGAKSASRAAAIGGKAANPVRGGEDCEAAGQQLPAALPFASFGGGSEWRAQ